MSREDLVQTITGHGRQEMSELVVDVVSALEAGGLADQVDVLGARVLARGPQEIFDIASSQDDDGEMSFKPMVELLLREVLHLARLDALPAAVRVDQIRWTLEMAGF
jgi:hypothetical protein